MIGHFIVDGDQIFLFNDAECPHTQGAYTWTLKADALQFEVIDDDCGFDQRMKDFTAVPWKRTDAALRQRPECEPPNVEAAISGHWNMPSECS